MGRMPLLGKCRETAGEESLLVSTARANVPIWEAEDTETEVRTAWSNTPFSEKWVFEWLQTFGGSLFCSKTSRHLKITRKTLKQLHYNFRSILEVALTKGNNKCNAFYSLLWDAYRMRNPEITENVYFRSIFYLHVVFHRELPVKALGLFKFAGSHVAWVCRPWHSNNNEITLTKWKRQKGRDEWKFHHVRKLQALSPKSTTLSNKKTKTSNC